MSQNKLLSERKFAPLFWTQFLGAFNDNLLKNALVILIAFKGVVVLGVPSEKMVVLAGGIFILPFFIFSAIAGQIADRFDKSSLIRFIKITEIGIMLIAALGFTTEMYGITLFSLFLMGVHSTFFGPIKYSILPQHLNERELVGGNALIEAGTFLAILIGTISGGVLASMGTQGVWVVSIGLIVLAVLGLVTSLKIPKAPPVDLSLKVDWNPIRTTIDIIKFTKKNRPVFLSILGISWFWFFGASMLALFPLYGKDVLKAKPEVVTLFLALFSIGIGVGSLLCEKMSRQRLEIGLVPFGSIGISIFTFDLFLRDSPTMSGFGALDILQCRPGLHIVFDLLFLSIFSGFFIVPLYTLIQERSEKTHRSRIIAANNVLNAIFMVAASGVLVGLMALKLSVPQIFLVLAILNAVVAAYIYTLVPEFLFRFLFWIVANFMYRIEVNGQDNIPAQGAVVLVCNHVSFVDWMLVAASVPRPVRFVMDYHFMKNRLIKRLMTRAKVIPIATQKESPEILESAFEKISDELRLGEIVCIFPEGKITKDGRMNPFRPGIQRILGTDAAPVVPMALVGMWGSFFSREGGQAVKKVPRRFWSRVKIKFSPPMAAHIATPEKLFEMVDSLLK